MSIAIGDDHVALLDTVRRFTADRCPPSVVRAAVDADDEALPPFWDELAALGWLGLHLPEPPTAARATASPSWPSCSRSWAGRSRPGRSCPPCWPARSISAGGGGRQAAARSWPPAAPSARSRWARRSPARSGAAARSWCTRHHRPGAVRRRWPTSSCVPVLVDGDERWYVVERARGTTTPLDVARPHPAPGRPRLRRRRARPPTTTCPSSTAPAWWRLGAPPARPPRPPAARRGASTPRPPTPPCAASSAGPIGQFQGGEAPLRRHARRRSSRPAAWRGTPPLALDGDDRRRRGRRWPRRRPAPSPPTPSPSVAKDCIQVLGGIGFTWEHDAHLYLRRAIAMRQLLGGPSPLAAPGGRAPRWPAPAATCASTLPPEAEAVRGRGAGLRRRGRRAPEGGAAGPGRRGRLPRAALVAAVGPRRRGRRAARHRRGAAAGPHPRAAPAGGRVGGAHHRRPRHARAAGALGAPDAARRDRRGASSSASPRPAPTWPRSPPPATRTDGGWLLNGQKVWTSMAREADWGICLARTNPTAPKHLGHHLLHRRHARRRASTSARCKEMTGLAMFNEVFFDDVFVPDDCVIGEVDGGWPLARTTLANERVSMGSGSSFGGGIEALLGLVARADRRRAARRRRPAAARRARRAGGRGALGRGARACAPRCARCPARGPGPRPACASCSASSTTSAPRSSAWRCSAPRAPPPSAPPRQWTFGFLANRCLTIAGGTSEIQRNVIAERLLGLPATRSRRP